MGLAGEMQAVVEGSVFILFALYLFGTALAALGGEGLRDLRLTTLLGAGVKLFWGDFCSATFVEPSVTST